MTKMTATVAELNTTQKKLKAINVTQRKWEAIDALYPFHRMAGQWHKIYKGNSRVYCSDVMPNGWGNFGCKRCNAIMEHFPKWGRNECREDWVKITSTRIKETKGKNYASK
jgi:hypothetical protein